MVNPFDRTFFKFLFGFLLILLASFGVLLFANHYYGLVDANSSHALTAIRSR